MQPLVRLLSSVVVFAVLAIGGLPAQELPVVELIAGGAHELAESRLAESSDRMLLLQAGLAWSEQDSTEKALRYLRRATEGPNGVPVIDSLTGLAFHKMGVVAYYAYQDSLAAVYYRNAMRIRDRVLPRYHNERAHSRTNLATVMNLLGRLDTAIVLVREANIIYENVSEPDSLNWLRNLNQLGEFAEASRHYRLGYSSSYRAVALLERMQVDPYDAFYTYYRAAEVLLRLNELVPAAEYARKAITYATRAGEASDLADAHNMLAIVQRELEQLDDSLENLLLAEQYARQTEDTATLGIVYLNLAEYYGGEGDRDRMERYDRLAHRFLAAGGSLESYYRSEKVPAILLGWGDAEAALRLLDDRLAYLTDGRIDRIGAELNSLPPDKLIPVIDMLGHRAAAHGALAQPDRALADYRALFRLQNRLREGVIDNESRGYLSQDLRGFYDRAIALLLERYRAGGNEEDIWEAFRLSEGARAYTLLASLQRNFQRIPPAVRQLQEEISRLERLVSLGADNSREALAAARIKMDRLQPSEVTSEPVDLPIRREALATFLREQDCHLLEYHLSPEGSVVFLFGADGRLRVASIPADSLLDDRVHTWRTAIEDSRYRRKSVTTREEQTELDRRFLETGRQLALQVLPADFREILLLGSGAPHPRLCIVPDGVLNYLPFAALPLEDAPLPLDYRNLSYLHASADLSYAYSAGYLLRVSGTAGRDYARDLVAFAPSFSGEHPEAAKSQGAGSLLRSNTALGPLLHSAEEVRLVAGLIGASRAYFDREANREQFLASLGEGRILHISSHGSVDPLDPNLSFVAFSQTGDRLQQDQLLYFNDLYGLPVNNELTVLSACETALGKVAIGETTMSFASAFAAAGARSTLTTLWQVDDAATKDLVVAFYRRLVSGASRLLALNGAQTDLRETEDYAHPYYWSSMTLYGASGPLLLQGGNDDRLPWWAWLVIGLSVITVIGSFLLVIRRADANQNPLG
ncbi:CHAT domain-containing protein [Neolewinella xylanilytica]|uniref:CHAT domain-containing protein n=1 Tax=Neolewinella xylanilytica TaxID=1514080 RepID=A0A2S6I7M7_9BACT|nr:CHAT domain-containing protein [Neolewinella xylanilytica]PPK87503.1 CHAT domain-containing protein [Neolewinella xylanilytica]